ncbi:uncharacterized protein BT62DRAFT_922603 [Guyanagaster necrorhizus]|uniref:Uncharacterized protein n=1 Tax=Guyanagaster necrorhizus TaxID=856835 RepID=A0A9P7VKQ3_9AGAR|nr:uncharacterized protein BT62DRAFT_922603 [Guyanagaster necrorhizus MCA 3950]KAG7442412.1 hypothetical protein BT62DRAFT_922603 [Guyanagaster necrorhizus MCA 3950]
MLGTALLISFVLAFILQPLRSFICLHKGARKIWYHIMSDPRREIEFTAGFFDEDYHHVLKNCRRAREPPLVDMGTNVTKMERMLFTDLYLGFLRKECRKDIELIFADAPRIVQMADLRANASQTELGLFIPLMARVEGGYISVQGSINMLMAGENFECVAVVSQGVAMAAFLSALTLHVISKNNIVVLEDGQNFLEAYQKTNASRNMIEVRYPLGNMLSLAIPWKAYI